MTDRITHDQAELTLSELYATTEGDAFYAATMFLVLKRYIAQCRQLEYCGQDGPCAIAPGCVRHWAERGLELVTERDSALARLKRVEEALEWHAGVGSEVDVQIISSAVFAGPTVRVTHTGTGPAILDAVCEAVERVREEDQSNG